MKRTILQIEVDKDLKNKLQAKADADERTKYIKRNLSPYLRIKLNELVEDNNAK